MASAKVGYEISWELSLEVSGMPSLLYQKIKCFPLDKREPAEIQVGK